MTLLRAFANAVDWLNERIGRSLTVLVWATAIVCAVVVFLRYVMHMSFTWMQELYVWIHAFVFLTGASFAMLRNAHVRVDLLYARWSPKTRAVVEIAGALVFTLPWIVVLGWLSFPFVRASWVIFEGSPQPNGIPAVFLLKSFLLVFCTLMTLQALSLIARGLLVLAGDRDAARRQPFGEPH